MDKKKILFWVVFILLVINIPFVLYLHNAKTMVFDEKFHQQLFIKYDTYSEFSDIEEINSELIDYLKYGGTLDIDVFNEKEITHMKDVRNLVQSSIILLNVLLVLFLILLISLYYIDKEKIGLSLIIGGGLTFLDAFVFFIITRFNFRWLFDKFHRIFFVGESWLFRSDETLVSMYQQGFFNDILVRIILNTFFMALLMIVVGLIIRKIYKYKIKNKKR